ncbi:uncharacterized protein LOC143441759 [Arvicanthis niloticus]|uniref:uncharacterized protein LOC143441759 n=1 Tax=Arvicanthis niloticus TaxID=61156 RepID=UPI00403CFC61
MPFCQPRPSVCMIFYFSRSILKMSNLVESLFLIHKLESRFYCASQAGFEPTVFHLSFETKVIKKMTLLLTWMLLPILTEEGLGDPQGAREIFKKQSGSKTTRCGLDFIAFYPISNPLLGLFLLLPLILTVGLRPPA